MNGVTTCLIFDGNCREAMTFYGKCFDAELNLMTFSEAQCADLQGEAKNRIAHARLTKSTPFLIASDTAPGMPLDRGNNFSVSVDCENVEEIDRLFTTIGAGGSVRMPLQETFWATRFGMLTDSYGVHWMFNLAKPHAG